MHLPDYNWGQITVKKLSKNWDWLGQCDKVITPNLIYQQMLRYGNIARLAWPPNTVITITFHKMRNCLMQNVKNYTEKLLNAECKELHWEIT